MASSVVLDTAAVNISVSGDYVIGWEFHSVLITSAVFVVTFNFSFDAGLQRAVSSLLGKSVRWVPNGSIADIFK